MASPAALSVMDPPFFQAVSSVGPDLASLLVKDASKRKRVNRNAKLKQCKLEARREQWLSQVTMVKHGKEGHQEPQSSSQRDLGEIVHHEKSNFDLDLPRYSSENFERVLSHSHLRIQHPESCRVENLKDKSSPSGSDSCLSNCSESEISPKSPGTMRSKGKMKRVGNDNGRGRGFSELDDMKAKDNITGSYESGAHNAEDPDHVSDNDDWEAAAEALGLDYSEVPMDNHVEERCKLDLLHVDSVPSLVPNNGRVAASCDALSRSVSSRAWRLDDVRRPASLPNLKKQQSLPVHFLGQRQRWVYSPEVLQDTLSGPSLCPICAEELDSTDSSFEPCVCGFQLCLFCHHRIMSDDGRCPGCRRLYNSLPSAMPSPALSLC